MYDHVLLPVSTDATPDERYEPIYELAAQHGATITILSVADTNRDSVTNLGGEVVDTLESEATKAVERFAEAARERAITVETETIQGVPDEAILEYDETHDIDVIVMRKRDRSRLKETLLGSVTDRVIRLTDTPVLVI
ncbi:universal stress protein [Halalkalicoccus subterraneus]|uniref:universal stress protein n=1 Tax=Halalkalicoccus subterraneus TaxID=2675002 RepID=UPI000EFC660B|nr:universal stress protein [Halalkalicoccus subterraneus]